MELIDFVIIGPSRSGSSLLCSILDLHPNIHCQLEHFYRPKYEEYVQTYKTEDSVKIYNQIAKEWNKTKELPSNPLTGFKFIFSNHRPETERLYRKLLRNNEIKKILITRNPLERYISNKIGAIATVESKNWLGTKLHGTKMRFDQKGFLNFLKKDNLAYDYALRIIQGPLLTIDYTDTTNTTAFKDIYNFLNVPDSPTTLLDWGGSTKQNYTQMSYKVENFTEMVEYLRTTPYKKWLV